MARKKKELDKLSLDMIQCEKDGFGVNYGRWKATQPIMQPKPGELPEGWLVCTYCGKAFKPKTKRKQLYCEPVCQAAASRERCRENYNAYKRAYNARKRAEEKMLSQ